MVSSNKNIEKTSKVKRFEISVLGCEDNILLLNGNKQDAQDVLFAGKIDLDLSEPLRFKKIAIRLLGKIRLDVSVADDINTIKNIKELKSESYFFTKSWDVLFSQNLLENDSNNIKRDSKFGWLSYITKNNLISSNKYHCLGSGHHEFYFKTILKGDITESLLGNENAFVSYQLVGCIQQIGNLSDLISSKQVRMIRTLKCDSLNLYHSQFSEDTIQKVAHICAWVPIGAIAIGSTTPVFCKITSIKKNIRVESVELSLIEISSYVNKENFILKQRKVTDIVIPRLDNNISIERNFDNSRLDHWNLELNCSIPSNLLKVSQSCSLLDAIEIKHFLKLQIYIKTFPGGIKKFELEIPVFLYISPLIPLGTLKKNYFNEPSLMFKRKAEKQIDELNTTYDEIIFNYQKKDCCTKEFQCFDNEWISKELIPPLYNEFKMYPEIKVVSKTLDETLFPNEDNFIFEYSNESTKKELFDSYIHEAPPPYKSFMTEKTKKNYIIEDHSDSKTVIEKSCSKHSYDIIKKQVTD